MLSKQNKKFQGLQATASAQQAEIQRLNNVIQNSENERLTRRQEHETLTAQRDLLGTQLIRRNDELALLYEKIKVQMRTLCSGEISFQEKKEEIRLMKLRIDNFRRQLRLQQTRANTSDDSKRKFYMLQRALLQERTKVRALSEELENPQNVHRWRKLEGMDPSHSEMIAKVKALQKRLIVKTEEAVEKDLQLDEQQQRLAELRDSLSQQPNAEVFQAASLWKRKIQNQTKAMKALAAEMNTHQCQKKQYENDIDDASRELADVKRKYFEARRTSHLSNQQTTT